MQDSTCISIKASIVLHFREGTQAGRNMAGIETSRKHGVTRDGLLDAGLKLFSEKGFDGTSVKEIEAAVGLTPGSGSFYRHFKSKEHLMEEVVHREIEQVRRWRASTMVPEEKRQTRETLRNGFFQSLEAMAAIKDLINVLAREYGQGRFPELMAQLKALLLDEALEVYREEYSQDIQRGVLRDMDPGVLSSILMSSLVGYHLSSMYFGSGPGGVNRQDFADGLAGLIMRDGR
jgi:AcrR family transcriptional regulator